MDSKEILDARRTISGSVNETPLVYSKFFSEACGGRVDLKLVTSSFKGRIRDAENESTKVDEAWLSRRPQDQQQVAKKVMADFIHLNQESEQA